MPKYIIAALLAALFLATSLTGCSREKAGYTLRPEFSVNVGSVDPAWPEDMAKLSLAEQEMLRMRGRPELIHIWWNPAGTIVDKMTVRQMQQEHPKDTKRTLTWIYLSRNEEVIFTDQTNFRVIPLNDQLKTVSELGDPQEVKRMPTSSGKLGEKWFYWNQGRFITFIDGVFVSEDKNIQPMPHYLTK